MWFLKYFLFFCRPFLSLNFIGGFQTLSGSQSRFISSKSISGQQLWPVSLRADLPGQSSSPHCFLTLLGKWPLLSPVDRGGNWILTCVQLTKSPGKSRSVWADMKMSQCYSEEGRSTTNFSGGGHIRFLSWVCHQEWRDLEQVTSNLHLSFHPTSQLSKWR